MKRGFMRLITVLMILSLIVFAKKIKVDDYFDAETVNDNRADFIIDASTDFDMCIIKAKTKRLPDMKFDNYCKFMGNKVCDNRKERCVKRDELLPRMLHILNTKGYWRVVGVASNDTLSVREGAGLKYKKVYELPYNARGFKVIATKRVGKISRWYKIRYKNITGWVNARFLGHSKLSCWD